MTTETATITKLARDCADRECDVFERQKLHAPTVRGTSVGERLAKLDKLKDALVRRRKDVQKACAADFNKPVSEVELTEIFPVLHEIAHAKRHLRKWMSPVKVPTTMAMIGTKAEIRYEPKGVCLIISPWNYPINLSFGPLVSAIAAGNTVILKPSEMTPHCSRLIRDIVEELFHTEEVAVFEGDADVAQRLLELPFDHIFFTGSPAIGKHVMSAAAKHLSSVTLELGGKSPAIVDETADIDKAVRNIVWGKFTNNGQTCIAPDYVYVHESVYDTFLNKTRERIAHVFGADDSAQRLNPDYCRIVNTRHFERINKFLDDAKLRGARVVTGGTVKADERFVAPTVLTNVSVNACIMQEEIFGPLLPVLSYRDLDQALDDINSRPKPLAMYMFSKDKARTEKMLVSSSAGGSCVNHTAVHFLHGNLPFGGANNSGIGNSHGFYGFKAFSHERSVLREHYSVTHWLFPPYTKLKAILIRITSRYLA